MSGLAEAVRRDLAAFVAGLAGGVEGPPRGLLSYRFGDPGGSTRIHLRVQDDGTGLLFRDANDLVHLSPSAAEMAWLALEDVPEKAAARRLERRFRGAGRARLEGDYQRLRQLVRTLSDPTERRCVCSLDLPQAPLWSSHARAPHKVDLALTYACENRCPHCYNEPGRTAMGSLSVAEWRGVLDRLARLGVPHVIFTGGEPTSRPELSELISYAERLGQIAGLNTNGRRLGVGGLAARLARAGLDHVQVTLASHDPAVHDAQVGAAAFGQTLEGIRRALDAGLHVITNSTITRRNAFDIEDTVSFLHGLGLRAFAMNGMIRSGGGVASPDALSPERLAPVLVRVRDRAAELGMRFIWYTVTAHCELSPFELEIGATRCNAGEYSMCVEPNGDVLPCQSYYVAAGNLLRDPWERIWDGELFRSFRFREREPGALPDRCRGCPDLTACGGGCRLDREAREGRAFGAEGRTGCASR